MTLKFMGFDVSSQRQVDYIVNPMIRKEPEGSLDLWSLSLCGSILRGFWIYYHSILPKQYFTKVLCADPSSWMIRWYAGLLTISHKSTTLPYFVTSVFGEFDTMAYPFSQSGTMSKSPRCIYNGWGNPWTFSIDVSHYFMTGSWILV